MQQCLPLSRRRKRASEGDENNHEGLDDAGGVTSTITKISDIEQMDAMTYLAYVNAEASRLPDIFVSKPSSSTSSPSKPLVTNKNDSNHQSSADEGTKIMDGFVPIDGSAAATEYLFSQKMQFLPPPSFYHLPRSIHNHDHNDGDIHSNNHNEEESGMNLHDWVNLTLDNFSKLRVYLHQCRKAGLGSDELRYGPKTIVPFSKDSSAWHIFCLGRDEACGNVGGYFHDEGDFDVESNEEDKIYDNDGNEGEENDNVHDEMNVSPDDPTKLSSKNMTKSSKKEWDASTVPKLGYKPTTQLLCQFDQIIIRRLIQHHTTYLQNGWEMTISRGKWIYALLSRLEKPLHRDDSSNLRALLRELCRVRSCITNSEIATGKSSLSLVNVLIIVTGVYFEQSDLSTLIHVH